MWFRVTRLALRLALVAVTGATAEDVHAQFIKPNGGRTAVPRAIARNPAGKESLPIPTAQRPADWVPQRPTQAMQASYQESDVDELPSPTLRSATSPVDPRFELVEFRDMNLGQALRVLGKQTDINFVASPSAANTDVSSVYLRDVSLSQTLDILASTYNLFYRRDETRNVVFLYTNDERSALVPDPKQLEQQINVAFPNSRVELSLVGDKVVVRGQAIDAVEAEQIVRIVAQSGLAQKEPGNESVNLTLNQGVVYPGANSPDLGEAARPVQQALRNSLVPGLENVVNLLEVPGVQQVMLRVIVAEVNRDAARSIGLNFQVMGSNVQARSLVGPINNLPQGNSLGFDPTQSFMGSLLGNPTMLDNLPVSIGSELDLAINAMRDMSLARTLAEPNLTAMNGETAVFHAGGRFPVPVLSGFSNQTQGVTFQPFGVTLQFTPLILDRDRVRLMVNAEVSVRAPDLGTSIGGDQSSGGTQVPGIDSRSFETTVELTDGQTLAVAGLIRNDYGATANRVPFFGDLPVIGRLASFDRTVAGEQELVILVTPELVQPINACEHPPLPGSDVFEPSDVEFYLLGRLESHNTKDFRSPARTDHNRQANYYQCQERFMIGPTGYTDVCHGP
jgi:Flp pilus assembly secretin CpaC